MTNQDDHEIVAVCTLTPLVLTVEKVGCHEEFQSYLPRDWELWNLCATVSVTDLVSEVLTHLGQDMGPAGDGIQHSSY